MLQLVDIEKSFGDKKALDGINLNIKKGEIFGLIGQEGAGKTTLFKIASGLMKPDRGSVWLGGERMEEKPQKAKMEVGYVPSSFRLYDKLTVKEYMEFYAGFYPLEGLKKERWIREILDQLQLLKMENEFVEKLSHGMSRRLCVAQALLSDPQLLILDETGNGLDARSRMEFRKILKNLSQTERTILISSHMISELPDYCTSVGILEAGKMMMQGDTGSIVSEVKKRQPLYLQLVSGEKKALTLLKENDRVKRITMLDTGMLIGFDGTEQEEAELLRSLIHAGVGVCGFSRGNMDFENSIWNISDVR